MFAVRIGDFQKLNLLAEKNETVYGNCSVPTIWAITQWCYYCHRQRHESCLDQTRIHFLHKLSPKKAMAADAVDFGDIRLAFDNENEGNGKSLAK